MRVSKGANHDHLYPPRLRPPRDMNYERCRRCSLPFKDFMLDNGLCPSCQSKILPDVMAIEDFKPLPPLFQAYEKELSE